MRPVHWILALLAAAVHTLLLHNQGLAPIPTPSSVGQAQPTSSASGETAPREPATRDAVGPADADVAERGTRRVDVVATLPSGDPAVHAHVRYRATRLEPRPRAVWSDYWHDHGRDLEVELTQTGRETMTDENGRAAICVAPGSELCVRRDDDYGEATVDDEGTEVRVSLAKDVPLRVQVLDSAGRPREGFVVEVDVHSESRLDGNDDSTLRLPPTDAHGVAVVPHLQTIISMPGADVPAWNMVLRCKLDPVVERAVSAAQFQATSPQLLQVPTGGAIAVEITSADGKSIWANAELTESGTGNSRDANDVDGVNWFRQLPLGRNWTLTVNSLGYETKQEVVGPSRADEVVRTRVELPLRRFELSGRVLRPDGVPVPQAGITWAGTTARCFHDTKTQSRDGSLGDTIGDFGFYGVLPADVTEVAGATLHIERPGYCTPTTIPLPPLHPGKNDLGDVVVTVAAAEIQLASVEVRIGGHNVSATAWARLHGVGDHGINTVASIDTVRADRILFVGPRTSQALEITAHHTGYLAHTVPVQLGGHAVIDLVSPCASLEVRLARPPVPRGLCGAELVDVDGREHRDYYRTDDGFVWRELPPGRYGLRLFVAKLCVHQLTTLDLLPGKNRWPREGSGLDLRHSSEAFHVDIHAGDDGKVEWPRCYLLPVGRAAPAPDFEPGSVSSTTPNWFVPQPQPVELVITAPGFVPKCIPAPSADVAVRLLRCTTLRLHTAPGDGVNTIVRIVEDAVRDPWLRALDADNLHESYSTEARDEPVELSCAPGTIVEVVVERGGVAGPLQRVVIGSELVEVHAK